MYFLKSEKKEKRKKKKKKKKMHIYRAGDLIFFLCWTVADGKVCLAVERDFFSVNVPQLVSTEQNTIKKGECE